jgi:hypothetical protein
MRIDVAVAALYVGRVRDRRRIRELPDHARPSSSFYLLRFKIAQARMRATRRLWRRRMGCAGGSSGTPGLDRAVHAVRAGAQTISTAPLR